MANSATGIMHQLPDAQVHRTELYSCITAILGNIAIGVRN